MILKSYDFFIKYFLIKGTLSHTNKDKFWIIFADAELLEKIASVKCVNAVIPKPDTTLLHLHFIAYLYNFFCSPPLLFQSDKICDILFYISSDYLGRQFNPPMIFKGDLKVVDLKNKQLK